MPGLSRFMTGARFMTGQVYDWCVLRFCVSLSVLRLFFKFIGIIYKFVNFLLELRPSSGGVSAKRKWVCTGCESADELVKKKQKVTRVVVSDSVASQSFQPVEEPHATNTASETTRDTDHEEAEDLSADVPEVSATTSSELPTENPSSEENTQSEGKSGK